MILKRFKAEKIIKLEFGCYLMLKLKIDAFKSILAILDDINQRRCLF